MPALLAKASQQRKPLNPAEITELSEIIELNPEGVLMMHLALDLNQVPYPGGIHDTVAGWMAYQNGEFQVGQLCERAYRAEGSIAKVQTGALDLSIACYAMSGMPVFKHKLPLNRERMAKALQLLQIRWKSESWQRLPILMPFVAFRVAYWGQDYGLAQGILQGWKPSAPTEKAQWHFSRALLDTELGAYQKAHNEIEQARRLGVDDPGSELDAAEKRCREALRSK